MNKQEDPKQLFENLLKLPENCVCSSYKYTHYKHMKNSQTLCCCPCKGKKFDTHVVAVTAHGNGQLENLKRTLCIFHNVFIDPFCSGCFFDQIDCLLLEGYKAGLEDETHQNILKNFFKEIFKCFKRIIVQLLQVQAKAKLLTPENVKKRFYPSEFFEFFKKQCELILWYFKKSKPFVQEVCIEAIFIQRFDALANCLKVNIDEHDGHYPAKKESRFIDITSEVLKREFKNHPYHKKVTALKIKESWEKFVDRGYTITALEYQPVN